MTLARVWSCGTAWEQLLVNSGDDSTTYSLYASLGAVVSARFALEPGREASAATEACVASLDVLAPLVRPLHVAIDVAGYPLDFPIVEEAVPVERPSWRLTEAPWPQEVAAPRSGSVSDVRNTEVDRCSAQQVRTLLDEACQQPVAQGHQVALEQFTSRHTMTWFAEAETSDHVVLEVGRLETRVPLTVRDGAVWILGPRREPAVGAPVTLEMSNWGTELELVLRFGWSLFQPDTEHHRWLLQCLRSLGTLGWELATVGGVPGLPPSLG